MIDIAIKNYYKLFDETIESSTFIVLFITLIIFFVGAITPAVHASDLQLIKANILSTKLVDSYEKSSNIVTIDGVRYEMYFTKLAD